MKKMPVPTLASRIPFPVSSGKTRPEDQGLTIMIAVIASQYPVLSKKRIALVTGVLVIHKYSPGGIHLSSYIPGDRQRGEQL